jgi:hypothetical protein
MFAQTLYVQWKWNRDFLAFYTIVAFAAPLVILWAAVPHLGLTSGRELVSVGGAIGVTTGVIAVLAGLTIAWQGYGVDERAGHIYALSLPVTRGRALAISRRDGHDHAHASCAGRLDWSDDRGWPGGAAAEPS